MRTILAVERLAARYGQVSDESMTRHLSDLLLVSPREARQRLAWFSEWMHEKQFLDEQQH